MIEKIEITGTNYQVEESFRKYAIKRISKLDKFLPAHCRKDPLVTIFITEVNHPHGNKYEISATMEIVGGKTINAKDECANLFAGIDLIEAKLTGQIRRFKLESTPHLRRFSLKNLFIKRK